MRILKFDDFLNENDTNRLDWKDMKFETSAEKSVADIAEETFLGKDLIVICKGDHLFTQLEQMISTAAFKPVLEITGVRLYLYNSPFEFIKWDTIGASPEEVIDTCYILSRKDLKKF